MNEQRDTHDYPGGGSEPVEAPRRLTRSRDDRYIGGVAAGLANYFNIDPTLVRVAFVVSLAIGGVGVFAYLVLLALVPVEGSPDEPAPAVTGSRRTLAIGATVLVGILLLVASAAGGSGTSWLFGFGPGVLFGILLWIAVAAGLIWALGKAGVLTSFGGGTDGGQTPAAQPAADTGETQAVGKSPAAAATPASSPAPVSFAPSPSQTASSEAPTEVQQTDESQQTTEMPPPRDGSGAPSTFGKIMTWLAIAFTGIVLLSIVALISFGVTALFGAIPAAVAVIGCGIGVVALALADRPQFALWTTAAAIAIAIPMAVVSIASLDVEGDWGDINESPTSAFEIPADGYKMAGGALKVDLRDFPFRNGRTVELITDSGFGATSVIVPDDVCVVGDIEGKVGYIDMRGSESSGIDPRRSLPLPAAKVPVLRLDSEFRLGYFGVFDDSGWRGKGQDWPDDLENPERSSAVNRASKACGGSPEKEDGPAKG
jgi:phage shock protein PspC (stress-responsive transcriptional regulator)